MRPDRSAQRDHQAGSQRLAESDLGQACSARHHRGRREGSLSRRASRASARRVEEPRCRDQLRAVEAHPAASRRVRACHRQRRASRHWWLRLRQPQGGREQAFRSPYAAGRLHQVQLHRGR